MKSFSDVWDAVCNYCSDKVSDVGYNMWIKTITPVELKNGEAILQVTNQWHKNVIFEGYSKIITDGFEAILGFPVTLNLLHDDVDYTVEKQPAVDPGYEYTFENYIVGNSNRFAHAASMAVAENPSIIYNPLFIYGNSGVGKTHLMLAIYNRIKEKYPQKKLFYVRAENFTNDLIQSLSRGTMNEFREKFRTADILLIDDIQFIAGKEQTQEEFFNTFNSLYPDKQIIVTSDRPPKDIKTLDERIRSRFEGGLLADIQPPEFETRVGIIKRKANILNLEIDDDVVYYIANQIKMNIRQLEGVVKKLQATVMLNGVKANIATAQSVIRDIRNDSQPEPVTIAKIISEVSRTYAVSEDDILSNSRIAPVVKARQIAIYISREITQMSLEKIGEQFGKNHSTIVHSLKTVNTILKQRPREKETVEDIIKNLQATKE